MWRVLTFITLVNTCDLIIDGCCVVQWSGLLGRLLVKLLYTLLRKSSFFHKEEVHVSIVVDEESFVARGHHVVSLLAFVI